jgi:primary-amine oxidase
MKLSLRLLLAGSILYAHGALSAPSPDPKAAWIRQGRARKAASKIGRRWSNETTAQPAINSCSDNDYTKTSASKANVWGGLTDIEAASVTKWLFTQPEFNLTVSDDAGEWDNSMYANRLLIRVPC